MSSCLWSLFAALPALVFCCGCPCLPCLAGCLFGSWLAPGGCAAFGSPWLCLPPGKRVACALRAGESTDTKAVPSQTGEVATNLLQMSDCPKQQQPELMLSDTNFTVADVGGQRGCSAGVACLAALATLSARPVLEPPPPPPAPPIVDVMAAPLPTGLPSWTLPCSEGTTDTPVPVVTTPMNPRARHPFKKPPTPLIDAASSSKDDRCAHCVPGGVSGGAIANACWWLITRIHQRGCGRNCEFTGLKCGCKALVS